MSVRRTLSDTLLRVGMERTLDRQELERGMATENPESPGYHSALAAIAAAKVAESVVLWVGWRLQPRTMEPH